MSQPMPDLNTPIGYRFTTSPNVLGHNGRAAQDAAMVTFQQSPPCVVGAWENMLELEDRVWAKHGWYKGIHGSGVAVHHEYCIEVNGAWRKLTQNEFDCLVVLNRRKRLSSKKK